MAEHVSRAINWILKILMLLIVGIIWFGTGADYAYKKVFVLPNVVWALLGILVLCIIGAIAHGMGALLKKCKFPDVLMLGVSGLFFVVLVVLSYHYYFKTGWDAQMVEGAARAIAENDWVSVQNKYFSYYPNNVFLTFVFSLAIRAGKILGISNYYFCIIIFQCFLFAATGFLLYQATRLCTSVQTGVAVWFMYAVTVGLSPWVVVPYSDATGILFPTLLFYLYVRLCRGKHVEVWIFLLALCSYVGYKIKPQTVIVTIAVVLVTLCSVRKDWLLQKKELLKRILLCVVGLFLGMLIVTMGGKATHLELDEELTFGMPHFLMMGLNEEYGGVINIVDQDFSMSFSGVEERNAANMKVAWERLEELGVGGLLRLWKNKTLTNFADGTFAWWQEGGFYAEEMYEGNYRLRELLTGYYYEGGKYHEVFKSCSQMLWMGTLLGVLIAAFCRRKEGSCKELDVLQLSLIGIILFETIFEARARYLLIYAPLFILFAYTAWMKYKNNT